MSRPAVFVDRDGTIIQERGYLSRPEDVELVPNAAEGLRSLRDLGLPVFVATNQAGVAKRVVTLRELEAVNLRVIAMLAMQGSGVDGIYYCPHHPEGEEPMYAVECGCRKPRPGLLQQAAGEHGIDLTASFMIGDTERDLQAGREAGARSILVLTGNGRKTLGEGTAHPDADHVAADLVEAAAWIAEQIRA